MTLVAQEIPKVGLVMEEVRVVRWLKNVGDSVIAGEPLLEVETEKSVVEIEAAATGRLTQILVQVDSQAVVGDQVAWIESAEAQGAAAAAAPRPIPGLRATPRDGRDGTRARRRTHPKYSRRPQTRRRTRHRSWRQSAGTGPGGRVQLDDVQRAIDAPRAGRLSRRSLFPRCVARWRAP